MKTQAIHVTIEEAGLLCNLLYLAMKESKREFKDQPKQVQMLSTKLARAHAKLGGYKLKAETDAPQVVMDQAVESPAVEHHHV